MSVAFQEWHPAGAGVTEEDGHRYPALKIDTRPSAEEQALFRNLLVSELPTFYDEVDTTFPDMILDSAGREKDPCGYFTKAKRLYVGRLGESPQVFTVATFKRGGSVKLGPTVAVPTARRRGLATVFRRRVEGLICAESGVRKLYLTITASNSRTILFNLNLGYQLEGVLRDQYRDGSAELVLGRMVRPGTGEHPRPLRVPGGDGTPIAVGLDAVDIDELADFLLPRMRGSFDDIDGSFAAAIIEALAPERQRYERKGKLLLVARRRGAISGVAVLVPKRGGSTKVSPLLADDAGTLRVLIDSACDLSVDHGRRRLYAIVPRHHCDVVRLLEERGFTVEARLREAYHRDVDVAVLGRYAP